MARCETSRVYLSPSSCRLLSTFQKELEEITIIAMPEEMEGEGHGRQTKAVQLHSFIDPAKGIAGTLQTSCMQTLRHPSYNCLNLLSISRDCDKDFPAL